MMRPLSYVLPKGLWIQIPRRGQTIDLYNCLPPIILAAPFLLRSIVTEHQWYCSVKLSTTTPKSSSCVIEKAFGVHEWFLWFHPIIIHLPVCFPLCQTQMPTGWWPSPPPFAGLARRCSRFALVVWPSTNKEGCKEVAISISCPLQAALFPFCYSFASAKTYVICLTIRYCQKWHNELSNSFQCIFYGGET